MIRNCLPTAIMWCLLSTALYADQTATVFHLDESEEEEIGYSQAMKVGNTIYVSGTVAVGENLDSQLRVVYAKIRKSLGHFNADFSDIVKETIYTTDMEALKESIPSRKAFYGEHQPTATWIKVSGLHESELVIEIDIIAVVTDSPH